MTPQVQTPEDSTMADRQWSASLAWDSDTESVQETIDSNQQTTVSQEIMSSSFVMSMFALPDSDDEAENTPTCQSAIACAPAVIDPSTMDPVQILEAIVDGKLTLELSADWWQRFDVSGGLGVGRHAVPDAFVPSRPGTPSHDLHHVGYSVFPPHTGFAASTSPALVAAIDALTAAGWPPVFVFVFDELWAYIAQYVQPHMATYVGQSCLLEPSVYCWALSRGTKAGESFTLPHRDYPYSEAFDGKGRPTIMNVWVPLTDATLDNGCMYVLPKEFDPLFDKPEHPNHLKSAIPGPGPDEFRCRINFGGGRPLPAPAASVLCWNGNTVHWGTRCSKDATTPRVSFSVAFRRKSAMTSHLESSCLTSMTPSQTLALTLQDRVQLIAKGLLLFKWWFGVDRSILPPEFFSALKPT